MPSHYRLLSARQKYSAATLACVALVVLSCSDHDAVAAPDVAVAASVQLTMSSGGPLTAAGETRSVTAVVGDIRDRVISSPPLTWSSSAPAVVTVSETGNGATITAVADGSAEITATSGLAHATLDVTVRRKVATIVLSAPSPTLSYGASVQLTVAAYDTRQNLIQGLTGFTFTSSNPRSVVVSQEGVATALFDFGAPATSVVTATLVRDGSTASGTVSITATPPAFDYAALMLGEYAVPRSSATGGTGIAYFYKDNAGIGYTITWSLLSGPATSAHVHGPVGVSGAAAVVADLSPGIGSLNYGVRTGSISATDIRSPDGAPPITLDSLLALMGSGRAYVDVHTAAYGQGEIRGSTAGPFK